MSQKDFEILTCLKPLETLWSPLPDEKAMIYCKHLQAFGIDVLRKAVDKVSAKWDRLTFPPVAVIAEACGILNGTIALGGTPINADGPRPWEKRAADQAALVSEYITKYMCDSAIAAQAREERWDDHLRRYVQVVADMQAQMITKRPNGIAWSHEILPEGTSLGDVENWLRGFLKDCQRQADTGTIDVLIPTGKFDEWRLRAQYAARAVAGEATRMANKYGTSLAGALPVPGAPAPLDDLEQLVGRVGSDNTSEPPVWIDDSHD